MGETRDAGIRRSTTIPDEDRIAARTIDTGSGVVLGTVPRPAWAGHCPANDPSDGSNVALAPVEDPDTLEGLDGGQISCLPARVPAYWRTESWRS